MSGKQAPPAPDPEPGQNPGYSEPQPRDPGDARQPEPRHKPNPDEGGQGALQREVHLVVGGVDDLDQACGEELLDGLALGSAEMEVAEAPVAERHVRRGGLHALAPGLVQVREGVVRPRVVCEVAVPLAVVEVVLPAHGEPGAEPPHRLDRLDRGDDGHPHLYGLRHY